MNAKMWIKAGRPAVWNGNPITDTEWVRKAINIIAHTTNSAEWYDYHFDMRQSMEATKDFMVHFL